MTDPQILEAARILLKATQDGQEIDRISSLFPDFTLADAYRVQRVGMKLREDAGARWVGWKMGLTSEAKRQQMNLDSAIFGYLHDRGAITTKSFGLKGLIHPKIEPEIGFRMKRELRAERGGQLSFGQAVDAIGGVCAAMEVIDSRYKGFKYFSLPDVVADNCSAAQYVWGAESTDLRHLALEKLKMTMSVNGQIAQEALASEISGHPIHSLMQLAEMLAEEGLSIPAGCIVLAGAATPAVALEPGQTIELKIDGLIPLTTSVSV